MEEEVKSINELIKENKLKFKFLDEHIELEVLQVCYNKAKGKIEIEFRNTIKEYIEELKDILNNF